MYITKHRTIIYGGHPKWRKHLNISNIKMVKTERGNINYNQIQYYERLWIYTEAMEHHVFWKCVQTAKRHNIPFRIFSTTSASRCEKEIISYDKGE